VTRKTENGKRKADAFREFVLVNSMVTTISEKNRTKINSALDITDRESNHFEILEEVTSVRRCFSG